MTFSSYYAHTAPIFKDLTILTIDKLIVHRIGITMYKYSNGLLPDVFNALYIKNSETHTIYNSCNYNFLIKFMVPHPFSFISSARH